MKNSKIVLLMAFCFIQVNYAQIAPKSEIIISEDNLVSLINKIKQKRDSLYYANQSQNKVVVNNQNTSKKSVVNTDNQRFKSLEDRMALLDRKIDNLSLLLKDTTAIAPKNKVVLQDEVAKTKNPEKSSNEAELLRKIDALELEISQLKGAVSNNEKLASSSQKSTDKIVVEQAAPNTAVTPVPPTVITNNYYTQPKTETVQKSIRDTIVIEKRVVSDYPELVKKYSTKTETILFDNNSAEVKTVDFETLDKLVVLCNSNAKIDLFLKGFASKSGNAAYNQKLSMKRTENVKKYLIEKGIPPTRILSQYYGVDYASKNEENARRVTISFVVRR